jgi:hypothetical protein
LEKRAIKFPTVYVFGSVLKLHKVKVSPNSSSLFEILYLFKARTAFDQPHATFIIRKVNAKNVDQELDRLDFFTKTPLSDFQFVILNLKGNNLHINFF